MAPLVAFGKPSKKSVEALIRKRGFGKVDKKRIPISDNKMVEEALVSRFIPLPCVIMIARAA